MPTSTTLEALLYVQVTEGNTFHVRPSFFSGMMFGYPTRDYNHREVEVIKKGTTNATHLITNTKGVYDPSTKQAELYPGVCETKVPFGDYTIKATIDGETVSRTITLNKDTKVLLLFQPKKSTP